MNQPETPVCSTIERIPSKACCDAFLKHFDDLSLILQSHDCLNPGNKFKGIPFRFCPWCGKDLSFSKLVYDPNMPLPPPGVFEAAKIVEGYFNEQVQGNWEFMGLRKRFPRDL